MKKYLLVFMSVLLLVGMAGCGSDDCNIESIDDNNGDSGIYVDLLLQDESGTERYTFNEGENIIFRIDIINKGNEDAYLPDPGTLLGNDIFHVYSSKGDDFGKPFDRLLVEGVNITIVGANNYREYLCPWVNNSDSELAWNPGFLNYQIDKLRPLPKGDYYSEFTLRLDRFDNNVKVTCKKSFKIE